MITMHAMWNAERLGMTFAQAATYQGFGTSRDLSRYVRAHSGLTLRSAAVRGFDGLLVHLLGQRRK
jgi:hypothetical protein